MKAYLKLKARLQRLADENFSVQVKGKQPKDFEKLKKIIWFLEPSDKINFEKIKFSLIF